MAQRTMPAPAQGGGPSIEEMKRTEGPFLTKLTQRKVDRYVAKENELDAKGIQGLERQRILRQELREANREMMRDLTAYLASLKAKRGNQASP